MHNASFPRALGLGLVAVIGIIILGVLPPLRGIADALLYPGAALPVLFWGGVHDPLQLLLVLVLNVLFYSLIFYALELYREKRAN